MIMLILFFTLLIISLFIIIPFLWCTLGRIFKINDITFKKALITFFIISLIGLAFQIADFVLLALNTSSNIFSLILSIAGLVLVIYVLKVKLKTTILKSIGLYISSIVFAVCFALLIRIFIVYPVRLPTSSLKPTILNDERVLINKLSYLLMNQYQET